MAGMGVPAEAITFGLFDRIRLSSVDQRSPKPVSSPKCHDLVHPRCRVFCARSCVLAQSGNDGAAVTVIVFMGRETHAGHFGPAGNFG